jgi:hypothetical protein
MPMETIKTHDLPAARLASKVRLGSGRGGQSLVSAALAVNDDSTIKAIREDAGVLRILLAWSRPHGARWPFASFAASRGDCVSMAGITRTDGLTLEVPQ